MKDYYQILGIQQNATQDEIKKAYFKKVRIHSPEKDPENFKLIREAYEVLSNEKLRRAYDTSGYQEEAKKKIEEAIKLMDENEFERASVILQKLMDGDVRFAICYVLIASCYVRLNWLDKAIALLEDALQDDCLDVVEQIDIAFILINILINYRMTHRDVNVVDYIANIYYEADEYVNSKIISFINESNETKNIRAMYYYIWLYNYLNEENDEDEIMKYEETAWDYVDILRDLDSLYRDRKLDIEFKDLLIYLHEYRLMAEEQDSRNVFNNIVVKLYGIGVGRITRNIEILKTYYNDVYEKYSKELNTILATIKGIKEKEEQNQQSFKSNYQYNQTEPTVKQQTQNKNDDGYGGCLFLILLLIFFLFHC